MKIFAISGSIRKQSSNLSLLKCAQKLAPKNLSIEIYESLANLPHFDPDQDIQDANSKDSSRTTTAALTSVKNFRQRIADSDALLISTPEYAHGIPGVLKNALDWLVSDTKFEGKIVGILFGSASDSNFAELALIEVLKTMSTKISPATVLVIGGARSKIDTNGEIQDQELKKKIKQLLMNLAGAIEA